MSTKELAVRAAVTLLTQFKNKEITAEQYAEGIAARAAEAGIAPAGRLSKLAETRVENQFAQAAKDAQRAARTVPEDLKVTFAPQTKAEPEATVMVGPFTSVHTVVADDGGDIVLTGLPPGERFLVLNIPKMGVQHGVQPDAVLAGGLVRRVYSVATTFKPGETTAAAPSPSPGVSHAADAPRVDLTMHPVPEGSLPKGPGDDTDEVASLPLDGDGDGDWDWDVGTDSGS